MASDVDLVESLATAAADAVRARRAAIEAAGAGSLRGITIELEPANRGAVLEVQTYLQWRQVVRGATK
jgi:hypothetical protein